MKALFYTTQTVDCFNHVRAWNSFSNVRAEHLTFDHRLIRNDWQLTEMVDRVRPDVVFYIGANEAPGNPKSGTFKTARRTAPIINICSDAADKPWHKTLNAFRERECFDLQVSIDGAKDSPVDFVTLTPVDPYPFEGHETRDIRCGFSGTVGRHNSRSEIVLALSWFGGLTIRDRSRSEGYEDHVSFLKRCRMVLNVSNTGSGQAHHIKGRVLEAGWAGCALLESEGSPIGQWFPNDCYLTYRTPKEAAEIISDYPEADLARIASRLAQEVRERFRPETIYGGMLERIGLVGSAQSRPAA